MVENTLDLSVAVAKPLDLRIGDYVVENNEKYELSENPQYSLSGRVYNYSALFVGNLHRLERWQMPDQGLDDFYFFGTMSDQIAYVVQTLNAITTPTGDGGWTYEILNPETIDASPRNVNYAGLSMLGSVQKIAQEFGVEFDLKEREFTFAVQIKRATALSFAVGQGKGLYKISRERLTDSKIATRLYGYGGKTNVEFEHRLKFDGGSFVEKNIDKYGLREDRVVFDHIYPRRNGAITADAVQKSEGSAYWRVTDTTLDFDLNKQIVEGTKVVFNSGECAGLEFEISSYDHATKTVTFKEYTDDASGKTYVAPNPDRRPRLGDEYVFTGILMPESYIAAAKAELRAATVAEIDRLSVPQHPYTVDCDPRYFKALNFTPSAGDLCHLVDTDSGLDASVRIVGVEYSPIEPWALKLTLSDKIPVAVASLIKREVKQTAHKVEVVDRRVEFNARKNAKALNELANFLLDPDGNFNEDLITARLIRARQYEGGNPSQDFSLRGVEVTPDVRAAAVSGGALTHHTYEVSGVGATWTIGARTFTDLDPDKAYYLYAKCSKIVLEGTFEIAANEELPVDYFSDEGYWVFNLGLLFKVRTGEAFRDFVATYGMFRQIGGQIIGSSLSSIDGFNVWNLDGGRFRVGTLDSYFDFNVSQANQLTLYNAKLISCTGNQKGDPGAPGAPGDPGSKGDYLRYAYLWTDSPTPPAAPVGSDPAGWKWNNLRGRVILDSSGRIMTDERGRMMVSAYPPSYRLWTSVAYFSGTDNTIIGMWSVPFVQSGQDGNDHEYIYRRTSSQTKPSTPYTTQQDDYVPSGWTDDPTGVDAANMYEWQCKRTKVDGVWSAFTPAALWAKFGADGQDGAPGKDGQDVDPAVLADLQLTYNAIKNNFTSIDGGLVLTSVIKLLNNGVENAGLSGLGSGDAPAFWSGGTYAGALGAAGQKVPNIILRYDGSSKLGKLHVNPTGQVTIKDDAGNDVSFFMPGAVTSLAGLLDGNASASSTIEASSIYLDTRQNIDPPNYEKTIMVNNPINVVYDNTEVFVKDLQIEFRAEITAEHRQSFTYASIYLSGDNGEYNIGSEALRYDWLQQSYIGTLSETHTINTSCIVNKGSYRLKVYAVVEAYGADGWIESWHQVHVMGGSLSYDMVANANKTQLGRGLAIVIDSTNHLYYGHNPASNRYEMVYKGHSDMPGVLAKARVSSNGFISRKWGKNIFRIDNITGQSYNKRVWFDTVDGEYSAICTGYGGGDNPKVYNETSTYVDLYANGGFNIMLIGQN